jgi:formamidopyrimidine-DNA glycosylase
MPEVAEVEIVRRGLESVVGAVVEQAEVNDPRLLPLAPAELAGEVSRLRRHGKLLGIGFTDGRTIAVHLRMTGALLLGNHPKARLALRFHDGRSLALVDPRRFATAVIVPDAEFGARLGPDILDDPDPTPLIAAATRSRRAAKTLFLDQVLLAGAGNYVADESFWRARLNPAMPGRDMSESDWRRLVICAHETALEALERGGASFSDYRHVDGSRGGMQEVFACYGRAGNACPRCATTLEKTVVAGRGTTFCSRCQSAVSNASL